MILFLLTNITNNIWYRPYHTANLNWWYLGHIYIDVVKNVGDDMCWWKLQDVCDSFWHFKRRAPILIRCQQDRNSVTISLSPSYVTIFLELYWLHKCNRIHHIRHISIQITIKLSWLSKSFLSLYLTFIFFHCMSAHQHLRHFYEYLWRLELEFRIEKTVSQRDSSIHPLSNPPLSAQIRNCICHLGLVQGGVSRTLEFSFFS